MTGGLTRVSRKIELLLAASIYETATPREEVLSAASAGANLAFSCQTRVNVHNFSALDSSQQALCFGLP